MWALRMGWIAFVVAALVTSTAVAAKKPKAGASEAKAGKKDDAASQAAAPASDAAPPETMSPQQQLGGDDADHSIKLRGLEERVNDLKERIFRSKARLILLRETVLSSMVAGAKAIIVHRNEMGSTFVLQSVSYSLDGAPIYNKTDSNGDLDEKEEVELFNNSIVPGNHILAVNMVYRGNGFGVFSYLKGYTFKIKSSYTFTAEEGKITGIKVVAYERGGFTTPVQDRPAVRYDVDMKQDANVPTPPEAANGSGNGASGASGAGGANGAAAKPAETPASSGK